VPLPSPTTISPEQHEDRTAKRSSGNPPSLMELFEGELNICIKIYII
jgi:hypothetical protein